MRKTVFLLIIIFISIYSAWGNMRTLKRYDVRSGLSENTVRCIMQDSLGHIWFATKDGLNRFNGVKFSVFGSSARDKEVHGLKEHLNIFALCPHPNNRHIWIGTSNQLYLFDTKTEKIEPFTKKTNSGHPIPITFSLTYDDDGILWIATGFDLFSYDEKNNVLERYSHKEGDPNSLSNNHCWCVYKDNAGSIWVATRNGVSRYNKKSNNFTNFATLNSSPDKENEIISITQSSDGALWLGTWSMGIGRLDPISGKVEYYYGENEKMSISRIRALKQHSNGNLMVASEEGLFDFNIVTKSCYRFNNEIASESIQSLFVDKEDGLWIGTYFYGVNYISKKSENIEWYYDDQREGGLSGDAVSEFLEDAKGNLWIATENGGLNYFDIETKRFTNFKAGTSSKSISYNNLHALLLDGDDLWIGTFSRGVDIMNLKTGIVKNYRSDQADIHTISDDHIYSLLKSKSGNIYIGTLRGATVYNPRIRVFSRIPRLNNVFVYDILEDDKGYIWIASKGDGVWRYKEDTGEFRNYRYYEGDSNSFSDNWLHRVYMDSKKNIWFCTEMNGISRYVYETDSFIHYNSKKNLPSSVVYSMLDDGDGYLWISTNIGLIKYSPEREWSKVYDFEDGLQSNQFNFRSSLKTRDGKLYFGGLNGFNCFYPSSLPENKIKPEISISSILVHYADRKGGKQEKLTFPMDEIVLSSEVASFDISFESLSFMAPSKNQYAYKIDGVHADWIYTQQPNVSFVKLPSGTYTFRVKGSNNDGLWSSDQVLKITISPPLWDTIYAKIFYVAISLFLLMVYIKYQNKRQRIKKYREQREFDRVREKELLQSKITFFTQVAHEVRTPVSLIQAPLEAIIERGKWNKDTEENLSIMSKNTNRLMDLVRQLLDFRKVDTDGHNLNLQNININRLVLDIIDRTFPPTNSTIKILLHPTRKEFYCRLDKEAMTKIITNLLSNAMKYASSLIEVRINEERKGQQNRLIISVKDDGCGISKEEQKKVFEPFYQVPDSNIKERGIGIGLSIVKMLVEKHEGNIWVNQDYTEGCELLLSLPINSEDYDPIEDNTIIHPGTEIIEEELDDNNISVLVVDDNPDLLDFLSRNLEPFYDVYVAGDGEKAICLMQDQAIDVIVSDVMMPVMDGFELLKHIRENKMLCHIPFILLSAYDSVDSKIQGLDYGADVYLEKPFSLNHLKATINSLLENRKLLFDHFASSPQISYDRGSLNMADSRWLEQLNEILERNLTNEEFTIEMLADELSISRSSLQRKLRGVAGIAPRDYIRIFRLKVAAKLLSEDGYRVNEVCFMVGFNNHSYFARCFKSQFGMLPKEYVQKSHEQREGFKYEE